MLKLSELWSTKDHTHVCGYLHHPRLGCLEAAALAEYFAQIPDESSLVSELSHANGCFALIQEQAGSLLAAVDKTRSYPIFWDQSGNLADKSEALASLSIQSLKAGEPQLLAEFLMTGFVTGADTLHPQLKQIPAGNYLKLEQGHKPKLQPYFRYLHSALQDQPLPELISALHAVHLKIAERVLNSINGRQIVIPLSGGYDSRLLAYLFTELGYRDILCFSYDSPRHAESRISQRTAQYLSLPWIFIEHSHKSWYEAYHSPSRREFYRYAVNASSSAHIQDWLAVKEMQKLISAEAVFIPGHTGDFIEGAHLPLVYKNQQSFSREELIRQISAFHYRLWPDPGQNAVQAFNERIQSIIHAPQEMTADQSASLYEYWDLQERQAKFIFNSMRVYESLGYSWRLPLWDSELMDFWAQVPLKWRVGRRLWHHYASQMLKIPVPIYRHPSLSNRIVDKLLRVAVGELRNVRYGRFAEYRNCRQYAQEKVANYLRNDINYPSFIKADRPLIRCDMNALQALIAIFELRDH